MIGSDIANNSSSSCCFFCVYSNIFPHDLVVDTVSTRFPVQLLFSLPFSCWWDRSPHIGELFPFLGKFCAFVQNFVLHCFLGLICENRFVFLLKQGKLKDNAKDLVGNSPLDLLTLSNCRLNKITIYIYNLVKVRGITEKQKRNVVP